MLNKISLEPEHFLRLCRGILTFNGTVYFHLFQKSRLCVQRVGNMKMSGGLGFFFFFASLHTGSSHLNDNSATLCKRVV